MTENWYAFAKRDGRHAEFILVVRKSDWVAAFDAAPTGYRSRGCCEMDVSKARLTPHRGYFQWKQAVDEPGILRGFK